jgi:hypothetical protein
MLVLATLALAARPTQPWPTDTPFVYEFGLARVWFDAPVLGGEFMAHAGPKKTWRWTCSAKPATRAGRQQMTCAEPGLGGWGTGGHEINVRLVDAPAP